MKPRKYNLKNDLFVNLASSGYVKYHEKLCFLNKLYFNKTFNLNFIIYLYGTWYFYFRNKKNFHSLKNKTLNKNLAPYIVCVMYCLLNFQDTNKRKRTLHRTFYLDKNQLQFSLSLLPILWWRSRIKVAEARVKGKFSRNWNCVETSS